MKKLITMCCILAAFFLMSCGEIETNSFDTDLKLQFQGGEESVPPASPGILYVNEYEIDGYGVYERQASSELVVVDYYILVNFHHEGAVIIHTVNYEDSDFTVIEGLEKDFNAYLTNACANLRMQVSGLEVEPVFGVNRNTLYRQVFHLAEEAIKNKQ